VGYEATLEWGWSKPFLLTDDGAKNQYIVGEDEQGE
jgi:hypothetical protein